MNPAKIRLSPAEMEWVNHADLILTKNAILKKVQALLEYLQEKQQEWMVLRPAGLPGKVAASSPKISKGENYGGLPYLVLDYPRVFDQEQLPDRPCSAEASAKAMQAGIFAVRTMFWWGHFFSVTLHLSGHYKKEAEEKLVNSYPVLQEKGFYCCINEDQWVHHFEKSNYVPVVEINLDDFEQAVREKPFIKLAHKIPLQLWDEAPEILLGYFKEFINLFIA